MPVDQTELPPPQFQKGGRVIVPTPEGTNVAGWLGTVTEREGAGYVTERDSHDHRIRALDAYAISLSALDALDAADVEWVFIVETDTRDVYEWKALGWQVADEVPDQFLEYPSDPQKFVPRDEARAVWSTHADDFFLASDGPIAQDQHIASGSWSDGPDESERETVESDVDDETNAPPDENDERQGDDASDANDDDASPPEVDDEVRDLLDEFDADSLDDLTDDQRLEIASRRGGL